MESKKWKKLKERHVMFLLTIPMWLEKKNVEIL